MGLGVLRVVVLRVVVLRVVVLLVVVGLAVVGILQTAGFTVVVFAFDLRPIVDKRCGELKQ